MNRTYHSHIPCAERYPRGFDGRRHMLPTCRPNLTQAA